jgi:hypothetical protein
VIASCGGVTVKNCNIAHGAHGVRALTLPAGYTAITVNNCLISFCITGLNAGTSGYIVDDYNNLIGNNTARTNVSTGANSTAYLTIPTPPVLLDGFRFPWTFGELSKWSLLVRRAGTGEATDDLFGITRPATSSKKSWGAIQYTGAARETTTIDGVSGASIRLPDAGEQFLMRVPVTNVSTVFTIKCYREADYAGTNPTFIVRQAGQADNTSTDIGAASAWNTLTITCTPAADPEWVDLFVVSYNTAVAGNYDCFFDTVTVT